MTSPIRYRPVTTSRYPGYRIGRQYFPVPITPTYIMVRSAGIYAIGVNQDALGNWIGTLLTLQRNSFGRIPAHQREWRPTTSSPFRGPVAEVVREAERRAGAIGKREARARAI